MLKPGVRLTGVRPEIILAIAEAREVWRSHGETGALFVITSVVDGRHARGSAHYTGCAFDLRKCRDSVTTQQAVAELREALGHDYDVLHEGDGTPNEHVHVEWDPKAALT